MHPSGAIPITFSCPSSLPLTHARYSYRRITDTTFPIIFCRNVMIYFNKATQEDLVNRLATKMEPGGYLFVGHSESLSGIHHPLRYVRPAVYQKAG
jgi:chemotaxis methyl-accepting protein methylase